MVDQTSAAGGTGNAPASGFTSTTSQANELLYGAIDSGTINNTGAPGFTPGTGWSVLTSGSGIYSGFGSARYNVNPEYQIVSATGTYQANGSFTASPNWGALTATYEATVAPAVTGISPASGPTTGGTSVTITGSNLDNATAVDFGTNAATIVSNTSTSITVLVPAGSTGTVDVTVTSTKGTSTTSPADQYTYKLAPTITWDNPADITYGTALSATQLDATASVDGTFVYTPAVGTVLGAGSEQALSVTFTPTDTTDYATTTDTVYINVNPATPTITWVNPADITYGTALSATQLDATASVDGTFVYTPTAGTVLGGGSEQALSVTFTPTDTTDYATTTDTVYINVDTATPTITWTNPADITYGTARRHPTGRHGQRGRHLRLHTRCGDRAGAGSEQALSVTFTPTDTTDYATTTDTVYINVDTATPTITWTNPADITYGTALSVTQLDATASVDGTFVYTPAAGTVLERRQ